MAEGNEILAYRGNAALGAGSEATVAGTGGADFSVFQSFMEKAMQTQYGWAAMEMRQAVQDRDDTLKMFSSDDLDSPVLDEDKAAIQALVDEKKKILLKNPDIKSNREAWNQVQAKSKQIQAKTAYAKTRYAEAAKQRLAAASEKNPVKKEEMYKHLDAQIKRGIDHLIDPHDQRLAYEPGFGLPEPKTAQSFTFDPATMMKTTTTEVDLSDIVNQFSHEALLKGPNVDFPYQIGSFYDLHSKDPDILNDDVAGQINTKIDMLNAEKGLKEGDRNFIQHIAEKKDGQWVANSKPLEFAKTWQVYEKYRKFAPVTAPDPEYAKTLQIGADIDLKKKQGQAALINANANAAEAATAEKNGRALRGKYAAEAREANARGDKLAAEAANEKAGVSQAVTQNFHLFAGEAKDVKGYKPVANVFREMLGQTGAVFNLASVGADPSWQGKLIDKSNPVAREMLSQPLYNESGAVIGKTRPYTVVMLKSPDGDPNKQLLVGVSKDGSIVGTANPNTGAQQLLQSSANFRVDEKINKQIDAARRVEMDMMGATDVAGFDVSRVMDRVSTVGSEKIQEGALWEYNGVMHKIVNGKPVPVK